MDKERRNKVEAGKRKGGNIQTKTEKKREGLKFNPQKGVLREMSSLGLQSNAKYKFSLEYEHAIGGDINNKL